MLLSYKNDFNVHVNDIPIFDILSYFFMFSLCRQKVIRRRIRTSWSHVLDTNMWTGRL